MSTVGTAVSRMNFRLTRIDRKLTLVLGLAWFNLAVTVLNAMVVWDTLCTTTRIIHSRGDSGMGVRKWL